MIGLDQGQCDGSITSSAISVSSDSLTELSRAAGIKDRIENEKHHLYLLQFQCNVEPGLS